MEPAAQKDCCCNASIDNPNPATQLPRGASGQTRDPVCGMVVAPSSAKSRAEHDGHTYYFCCGGCNAKFVASPRIAGGTIYTCPMHAQIRRSGPGSCPICGMALEPQGIPQAEGTSPELADMTRRFLVCVIVATPIFVLEMGGHLPVLNLRHYVSMAA